MPSPSGPNPDMGIATAVLAAGAGAIAVAAAPTSGTLDLAPKSIGTATAVCKPGRVAVSGGFEATNFAKNDSGMGRIGMRKGRARVTTAGVQLRRGLR